MENIYKKIMINKSEPLFDNKISNENHKIFYKYSSHKYYKYIYELLDTLCKKSRYENYTLIFHLSLYYILKILYNCENTAYLNNLDLIVLNSFSLGIKSTILQKDFPSINRLKKIYEEKYINYKNEEICEGEIICLKLLNYNINILTAYEYVIYLTENDTKLRELSLVNLEFMMVNNLKQFIYISSLDLANDCIKRIKQRIMVREPKIIKKKIISSNGFNCSPIIKKYLSTDKLVNSSSTSDYHKISQINNDELKIKIKKISNININKPKFTLINPKKSSIMLNNISLKTTEDKIYHKKNCTININNNIHPSSSTSLITESNLMKNNNDDKKDLFYIKLNKITGNKYIYKNNTSTGNYFKIKKPNDINKKKIYLNNNKIKYIRNHYEQFDQAINLNNTQYLKKNNGYKEYNILKENDSYYINLYNQRKDSSDENHINNKILNEESNNKNSFYNSFMKGIKSGIETKNINLGSLTKSINNSNFLRYNMSIKNNEKHEKLNSSGNYFNNTNSSLDRNFFSNRSLENYYIHW